MSEHKNNGKIEGENKGKKIIVMPLDDNSKEISQVLANDTARKILSLLSERSMTLTEICAELEIALSTGEYGLNKLRDAGLIKIIGTRKSEKNVEMKIYAPEEKFIVIAPKSMRKEDTISALKSLLPLLAISIVILGVGIYMMNQSQMPYVNPTTPNQTYPYTGDTFSGGDGFMKKFSSQEDLNSYIKYAAESGIGYYRSYSTGKGGGVFDEMITTQSNSVQESAPDGRSKSIARTPSPPNTDYADSSTSDFSQTNIQVEGVDEADIVKNDEKYIYVVSGKKVVIIDAYPAKNAKILSEIKFNENPSEIFINNNKLVVFTQEYNYNSRKEYHYDSQMNMNIAIYDISDRKNPKIEREIKADGNYFDSRMIGDYVYVIINEPIYYQPCHIYKGAEVDMKCISSDIKFPEVTMGGKKIDENFPEIYYWDVFDNSYHFTTVLSIDIQDKDAKPNKKNFVMSDAQNMYVSHENIYITKTKWMSQHEILEKVYDEVIIPILPKDASDEIKEIENSNKSFYVRKFERILVIKNYFANLDDKETEDFQKKINDKIQEIQNDIEKSGEQTVISRIGIKHGRITPKASGSVPGTILNQFSMDEHNKNFRIATTTQKYSDRQANNIYVLDENLMTIGKVEGIAPGESIYSVRFMGKKAYMVTFKRVDPLFVIDLSNPEKPTLVGKLKIPGYSDYLHPYDENHLIGIGKEVDESIDADKVHSSDAVYYTAVQGVKLAIFDVSDINHPVEMYKEVIGDRGTDSEATQDHKAFLFDREKNLLVIPIKLAEISDAQKKSANLDEKKWKKMEGEFTFQGAYIYDISLNKGFKLRGRVTHIDDTETLMKSGYYFDSPYSVKRSLYIDDVLYTISDKKVNMNDLRNITYINEVELPYEYYNYGRTGRI